MVCSNDTLNNVMTNHPSTNHRLINFSLIHPQIKQAKSSIESLKAQNSGEPNRYQNNSEQFEA